MSLKRLLFLFAIAAACTLIIRAIVFEGFYVASASMEPAMPVGTQAIVDKVTLRFRAPERGEIIAFSSPVPPHKEMVKRVIAVPGDTIALKDKRVILNGDPMDEPYVRYTREDEKLKGDTQEEQTVPEDHYYVLGDNRDESNDSASWLDPDSGERVHFVPKSRVRGLVRGFY